MSSSSIPLASLVPWASLSIPSSAGRWLRVGPPGIPLSSLHILICLSLKLPPSLTAQSGYNRCSSSLSAPERSQGAPQPLLAPLWFELPDFALEIIDAGICIRQLTIVIFHFLAELLLLELHIVQLEIRIL